MKSLKILFFIQLVLMLTVSGVIAQDYYVSSIRGNGDNFGTGWNDAFSSITEAINAIMLKGGVDEGGDTVFVGQGDYYELVNLTAAGIKTSENSWLTLKGIKKPKILGKNVIYYGMRLSSGYVILEGFKFEFHKRWNIEINSDNNIIKNNHFFNDYVYGYSRTLIFVYGFDGNIIKNNILGSSIQHEGNGINLSGEHNDNLVYNNTFYNLLKGIEIIGKNITSFSNEIYNNVFVKCDNAIEHRYNVGYSNRNYLDFNNIYDCGIPYRYITPGENSIAVEPEFIDASRDIFQLKTTSLMIKAGRPADNRFQNIGACGTGLYFDTAAIMADWSLSNVSLKNGKLTLSGATAGTIESPWIELGSGNARLRNISYKALEWEKLEAGFKQVIDDDEDYPREIKINGRVDGAEQGWQTVIPGNLDKKYDAVKIRLTLRKNAN